MRLILAGSGFLARGPASALPPARPVVRADLAPLDVRPLPLVQRCLLLGLVAIIVADTHGHARQVITERFISCNRLEGRLNRAAIADGACGMIWSSSCENDQPILFE